MTTPIRVGITVTSRLPSVVSMRFALGYAGRRRAAGSGAASELSRVRP